MIMEARFGRQRIFAALKACEASDPRPKTVSATAALGTATESCLASRTKASQ